MVVPSLWDALYIIELSILKRKDLFFLELLLFWTIHCIYTTDLQIFYIIGRDLISGSRILLVHVKILLPIPCFPGISFLLFKPLSISLSTNLICFASLLFLKQIVWDSPLTVLVCCHG